jgi:hypothetical protein
MAVLYILSGYVTSLDSLELRCPNCNILKELPTSGAKGGSGEDGLA